MVSISYQNDQTQLNTTDCGHDDTRSQPAISDSSTQTNEIPSSPHTSKLERIRSQFMQTLYEAIRNNADDSIVMNRAYQVKRIARNIDVHGGAK